MARVLQAIFRLQFCLTTAGHDMTSSPLRFLKNHPDMAGGIVIVATSLLLMSEASDLPFGTANAPDAGFFPKALSAILFVIGLVIISRSIRAAMPPVEFTSRSWAVALGAVALFLYAAFVNKIGFILSTITILFLLMTLYGRLKWLLSLAIAVSAVTVCYVGFTELGVPLPRGLLGFF